VGDRDGWEDWQRAEYAEQCYMASFGTDAGAACREQLGMSVAMIGGGVVWATKDDMSGGFFSRAVGQGVTEPVSAAVVDEVLSFARDTGTPLFAMQLAPNAVTPDVAELLADRGLHPGRTWDKLVRDDSPPPTAETDLRIEQLGPELAREYGELMLVGFGLPESARPFAEAPPTLPGWTTYGAFDGDTVVGVAGICVEGDLACLSGAATFPEHRGRGAQRALMSRRLADARARGVRHFVTETWSESEGNLNPSLHNMHWAGFRTIYPRVNYVRKLAD
jgi:GNAT superfamily N-acetyltransferase